MTDATDIMIERLRTHFGARALSLEAAHGEATMELAASEWLGAAHELRDALGFEIAIDLCGLDYLSYGQDEWETADATSGGFSRGVEGNGPGRFAWSERPSAESVPVPHVNIASESGSDDGIPTPAMVPAGKPRFAVVLHLLSIQHNQRLRVRCRCADPVMPVIHSLTSV
ncbi:MAG: NADH-quinone oxidoreductase subunit C, partial [Lysobacteraceae bacterium]